MWELSLDVSFLTFLQQRQPVRSSPRPLLLLTSGRRRRVVTGGRGALIITIISFLGRFALMSSRFEVEGLVPETHNHLYRVRIQGKGRGMSVLSTCKIRSVAGFSDHSFSHIILKSKTFYAIISYLNARPFSSKGNLLGLLHARFYF